MDSYIYTGRALARDEHTCSRCGARMRVVLDAIGTTGAIPDNLDTLAARETAIQAALAADVKSVMSVLRCPSCRERATLPVALAWARVAIWFALVPVLPIIAPGPLEILWVVPIGLAIVGLSQLVRERSRFRRADGALVLPLSPPTRDPGRPKPPTPAALPAARATRVPAAAPPAAAPPPPAPPPMAPRAPGASSEPQFLTDPARGPDDPAS